MGTTIGSQIAEAARRRGIDLQADPEASWCAGVLQNAPAETARDVIGRRHPPFRVLELADALRLDPDSLNDCYSEWILGGGVAPPRLPAWAFDRSEVQPWQSHIGPPTEAELAAPLGDPVRLPATPRPRSTPPRKGGAIFAAFLVVVLIGLYLNLSHNPPTQPVSAMFPNLAATPSAPKAITQTPGR